MVSTKEFSGKLGVYLTLAELMKLGIEAIPTPYFWSYDIITRDGSKLEVKFANEIQAKNGRGETYSTYKFQISPVEMKIIDFLVLVCNTKQGFLFYIVPKSAIKGRSISFHPFAKPKSQFRKFHNCWHPLIDLNDEQFGKGKNINSLKRKKTYFGDLDKKRRKEKQNHLAKS